MEDEHVQFVFNLVLFQYCISKFNNYYVNDIQLFEAQVLM